MHRRSDLRRQRSDSGRVGRRSWGLLAAIAVFSTVLITAPSAEPSLAVVPDADTTVASCAPLDVVFVVDTTGSMGSAIDNVKEQIVELTHEIEQVSGGDYRIGLVEFGDRISVTAPFEAGNAVQLRSHIEAISAAGGGDNPEAWDEALVTVVNERSAVQAEKDSGLSDRQSGDFNVPWRDEAEKIVLLITDARPAGFNDEYEIEDQDRAYAAAVKAKERDIRVATVFVPNGNQEDEAPSYLQFVAGLTHSTYFATDQDGSNLAEGLTLTVRACAADTDGDGLFDSWEEHGYDADGDGTIDVNLPAMGADPLRKDLFLQVNWMQPDGATPCILIFWCPGSPDGSHPPNAGAIKKVVAAFADAPVGNPDGSTGITLHVDAGVHAASTAGIPENLRKGGPLWMHRDAFFESKDEQERADTLAEFKGFALDPARAAVTTIVLYAHRIDESDSLFGQAPAGVPGDTVLISGQLMTSEQLEANTLMHEIGHTLGLRHGGLDDENGKPNYPSIMNYDYTLTDGLMQKGRAGIVDYSRFELKPLDEHEGMIESDGIAATDTADQRELDSYSVYYHCDGEQKRSLVSASKAIDWNCDGKTSSSPSPATVHWGEDRTVLTSRNDWATITFTGGSRGGLLSSGEQESDEGLTEEAWREAPKEYALVLTGGGTFQVAPGVSRFEIQLENLGTSNDDYALTATLNGAEIEVRTDASLGLASGETATIPFFVEIAETTKDSPQELTVSVRSKAAEWVGGSVTMLVETRDSTSRSGLGTLIVNPSTPSAGAEITAQAAGFSPGSAILLQSTDGSMQVAWGTADDSGNVLLTAQAPSKAGEVELVMTGEDPAGEPRGLAAEVTVIEASFAWLPWVAGATGGIVLLLAILLAVMVHHRRRRTPKNRARPPIANASVIDTQTAAVTTYPVATAPATTAPGTAPPPSDWALRAMDASITHEQQQQFAHQREYWPYLAQNPALYPGLRQWLRSTGDPATLAALAAFESEQRGTQM